MQRDRRSELLFGTSFFWFFWRTSGENTGNDSEDCQRCVVLAIYIRFCAWLSEHREIELMTLAISTGSAGQIQSWTAATNYSDLPGNHSTDNSLGVRDNILGDHLEDGIRAQFIMKPQTVGFIMNQV